jgi:hypothetical protein
MRHRKLSEVGGNSRAEKMLTLVYEALTTPGHILKPCYIEHKYANGATAYLPVIIVTDSDGNEYLIDWNEPAIQLSLPDEFRGLVL